MQIHWLEFENYTTGQKIERIEFDRLNLLVGESGAGKTQILKVLSKCINLITSGDNISFAGYFKINFSVDIIIEGIETKYKYNYTWAIKTKELYTNITILDTIIPKYAITEEKIWREGNNLVERDENNLLIDGRDTPQIELHKSALSIFVSSPEIVNIKTNMVKFGSYVHQQKGLNRISNKHLKQVRKLLKKHDNKKFLLDISIPTQFTIMNMLMYKKYAKEIYNSFIYEFKNVFPIIQDIKIDAIDEDDYGLFIKQEGKWIPDDEISSGMLKTIYILSIVEFSQGSSVILLDELENSLGVNCLDEITEYICNKAVENEIQFIITSHHPYIINNIPQSNWRIISQKNGVISSKRAADIGIDDSYGKHERFFKLINYIQRQSS